MTLNYDNRSKTDSPILITFSHPHILPPSQFTLQSSGTGLDERLPAQLDPGRGA